jgi:LysM repeat protein
MKRRALILLVFILTLALLGPNLAAAAGRNHTVQYGETLTSIAAQYGVSVDSLAAANGIGSPNLIFVGQTLTIPGGTGGSVPAPAQNLAGSGNYVVQPGDNLSTIAAQNGVSVDSLLAANSLGDANFIWAGQRLSIPGKAAPAPAKPAPATAPAPARPATTGATYTVQPGDYLSAIATRYGVSSDALAAANGLSNPNLLYSGQTLTIPGAAPVKSDPPVKATGKTDSPPAAATQAPAPPKVPTAIPAPPGFDQPTPTLQPASERLQTAPTPVPQKEKVVPAAAAPGKLLNYTVQAGDRLYSIAAANNTTVDAIVARNKIADPNNIVPGQKLEILVGDTISKPAANAAKPSATPQSMDKTVTKPGKDKTAPAIDNDIAGKWIDVNISTQTLTAYEGSNAVFSTLVSTGVSWHPTVVGTYKIYAKYLADDMSGGSGAEYYYLPAVPYTMYFYGGYAIHGTYWHHNFGHPMSHGCVNLPTPAAKWVYNWAPMGTTVKTHW